jgi:hypothetical protein
LERTFLALNLIPNGFGKKQFGNTPILKPKASGSGKKPKALRFEYKIKQNKPHEVSRKNSG